VPPIAASWRFNESLGVTALLAVATLTLLAGCKSAEEPAAEEIRPVRVVTVEKRVVGDTVSLTGTVQAETEINLSFRIDGRMIDRKVNVGDTVRVGQLVATLNPDNEQSAVQAARADLAAANARMVEAQNNFQRQRRLLEQNFISKAAFDQVVATRTAAESQVDAARANVDIAQNRLGYTRLVANAAGAVTAVGAEPGVAEPGEVVQGGRMIVQLAQKGGIDAVFDVPPNVKDIAPSQAAITVALTMNPKVTAQGRVREVSPRADAITGTFRVRVALIDPPPTMRLGSTVTGHMVVSGAQGIEIPASALSRVERQPAVWVVDPKTDTVSPRNVEVATFDRNRVVVAQGLQPGDMVVTAGVQALRPGQKVRLLEASK
jgi:RND family efflux transporter MFP subunit